MRSSCPSGAPWQVRLLAPRPLCNSDLNMVALPMLDLQAWLDGETPDPRRFAAARMSLSTLSARMEDALRLRRKQPFSHLVNHPCRTEHLGPPLEIEDCVGAGWSASISGEQAGRNGWQRPRKSYEWDHGLRDRPRRRCAPSNRVDLERNSTQHHGCSLRRITLPYAK